jgi:hypothetical protein
MFVELENQVWSTSLTGATIENNTDISIDGSSKKMIFTEPSSYVLVTFDEIDFSAWEEISLHFYVRDNLFQNLFTVTVGGKVYTFKRDEFQKRQWNHFLIDCSDLVAGTTIVITSIVPGLTLFVDYIGVRKVTYNCDVDIITCLKEHINLDYGISLKLAEDADIGDTELQLDTGNVIGYITDTSVLELDNGAGVIETVELLDKQGTLSRPITNKFLKDDEVRVVCPVRSEDYDQLEPDPICGIKVYDMEAKKRLTTQVNKGVSKTKEYLGTLGVVIYIDCKSKKKLLQMSREYNKKYGNEFKFLLDGEQVEIYMENSVFAEEVIGNNPRMAYFYRIEPQPFLYSSNPKISTINLETIISVIQ